MKTIFESKIHENEKSHDVKIVEVGNRSNGGKIVKSTYEAYNAVERFTIEIFNGTKWEHCASLLDLGEIPNSSAYITLDKEKRQKRVLELNKKAEKLITTLLL